MQLGGADAWQAYDQADTAGRTNTRGGRECPRACFLVAKLLVLGNRIGGIEDASKKIDTDRLLGLTEIYLKRSRKSEIRVILGRIILKKLQIRSF